MADDLVQRMRMNSIFPTAGNNPLQGPTRNDSGLDPMSILNAVQSMQANARLADQREEENRYYQNKGAHLEEIARNAAMATQARDTSPLRSQNGMNVVLGGGQTPAKLNGMTLDQADAARKDPYGATVADNYQHPDDLASSQPSALARIKATGDAQTSLADRNNAAKLAAQSAKAADAAKLEAGKETAADKLARTKAEMKGEQDRLTNKEKPVKEDLVGKRQEAARIAGEKQKRETQKYFAKETLDTINEVMNDKGELTDAAKWAVGANRGVSLIPGTDAHSARAKLENISSQSILNLLGKIKGQSRTGATGFGNMSDKDMSIIRTAANKLDASGSQDEYQKQLGIIRDKLSLVLEDSDEDLADYGETPAAKSNSGGGNKSPKKSMTPQELYDQYHTKQGGR